MTRALLVAVLLAALLSCRRTTPSDAGAGPSAIDAASPVASATGVDRLLLALPAVAPPVDWARPVPPTPPGGATPDGYVGSEACKECHAAVATSWARHAMARTGLRPLASLDPKWLTSIFDTGASAAPVVHVKSGFSYRPMRKGHDYYIEELVTAPDGTKVHSWVQPITYAYSAGAYGMAFFFRQGPRLYQAPLDYYAQVKRWGIDPGASEGNPRFSRPMRTFCLSCHGDFPRQRAGTDDVFLDPLPAGVGCERCHGPGAAHVKSLKPEDIVNPARLTPARKLDVCVQCHESDGSSLRAGRDDFAFRPGQVATDTRVNFVGEPPEPDRLGLLSHPERLMRSACWKGSKGALSCTSCHDPHRSSFDQPASWWDGKCNACHADKPCTESAAARHAQGDHCVTCHMRATHPANPTLVTITDHWIQRRPPPERPGTPNPEHLVPWTELTGEATPPDVTALEAVELAHGGHEEIAEAMVASLGTAPLHQPLLDGWIADRLRQEKRPTDALRALATLLQYAPDAQESLYAYADLSLVSRGAAGIPEAMHAIDRMLALDPDDPGALEMKGKVLFLSGRGAEARPLFEHAARAGPWSSAALVGLAVMDAQDGREAERIAELEAARRIEPGDAWILQRLEDAYTHAGDATKAAAVAKAKAFFEARPDAQPRSPASSWLPAALR